MLLPVLAVITGSALAGDPGTLPAWLLDDDDEDVEIQVDERPLWPTSVRIDTKDGIVSVDWFGDGRPPAWYALEDLQHFERSRPYEGRPDELFIVISDGTRILVTSGADVGSQAIVAPALADKPLIERKPGEGHITPVAMADAPGPALAVGGLGGGVAIKALSPTALGGFTVSSVVIERDRTPALDASIDGGGILERPRIDAEMRQRSHLFGSCYQRGLQRNAALSGVITLQFVIDKDGSVKGAWVDESTLGDASVEHCILEEVRQARFPVPKGGTVVVSYPLKF